MSKKVIKLIDEQLNTNINYYIVHNYKYSTGAINAFFKFYISFPESFLSQDIDIEKKETAKIEEFEKSKKIKNGENFFFNFRYSDFIQVDPKTL